MCMSLLTEDELVCSTWHFCKYFSLIKGLPVTSEDFLSRKWYLQKHKTWLSSSPLEIRNDRNGTHFLKNTSFRRGKCQILVTEEQPMLHASYLWTWGSRKEFEIVFSSIIFEAIWCSFQTTSVRNSCFTNTFSFWISYSKTERALRWSLVCHKMLWCPLL